MTYTEQQLVVVARRQAGAFSRAQAREAGLSPRQIEYRVSIGAWLELLPRVYAAAGAAPSSEQWWWAAVLWAGSGALLSHRCAGQAWVFDGVRAGRPEVSIPSRRNLRSELVKTHRVRRLHPLDRRFLRGLPVTSPERTLLDLAAALGDESIEVAFESARRERLVTLDSVERCLDRNARRGRTGVAAVRALVRQLNDVPSASALEVRVARLLRGSRLPHPVQQHDVCSFGAHYRLDFAWPDRLVGLECDGRLRHSEDSDFQHDRTKLTDLASDGWRILIVTPRDVKSRDRMIARLDAALYS